MIMARWQDSYAVGEHIEYRSKMADGSVEWLPARVVARTLSGHLRVRVQGKTAVFEYSQFKKPDIRKLTPI